jgi:acylphosphatase
MPLICLHALVSGRVQGVYFRQHTAEQAQALEVQGWVRNLADGRVEVWMEGQASAVRALADWLAQGSPAAQVSGVVLQEQQLQGLSGFIIQR